jgi:hypothetical protein
VHIAPGAYVDGTDVATVAAGITSSRTGLSPAARPCGDSQSTIDRLLSRLVVNERTALTLTRRVAPPITFDEVFASCATAGVCTPGSCPRSMTGSITSN